MQGPFISGETSQIDPPPAQPAQPPEHGSRLRWPGIHLTGLCYAPLDAQPALVEASSPQCPATAWPCISALACSVVMTASVRTIRHVAPALPAGSLARSNAGPLARSNAGPPDRDGPHAHHQSSLHLLALPAGCSACSLAVTCDRPHAHSHASSRLPCRACRLCCPPSHCVYPRTSWVTTITPHHSCRACRLIHPPPHSVCDSPSAPRGDASVLHDARTDQFSAQQPSSGSSAAARDHLGHHAHAEP